MGFSDMISSGRGPGFLGLMMALIVLAGFGALFVLVFDETLEGEPGVASMGGVTEVDMARVRVRAEILRSRLELLPRREAEARELRISRVENQTRALELQRLADQWAAAERELERLAGDYRDYRAAYRGHVRMSAVGMKIPVLETSDGRRYEEVLVRQVDPIGITIRHENGFLRVPGEKLPMELQEYFQFDPQERQEAIEQERRSHQATEREVEQVRVRGSRRSENRFQAEMGQARRDLELLIAMKEVEASALEGQIRSLESDKRAQRGKYIDRSAVIQQTINRRRAELSALRHEIVQLKSKL
jgi:hypothetical protein